MWLRRRVVYIASILQAIFSILSLLLYLLPQHQYISKGNFLPSLIPSNPLSGRNISCPLYVCCAFPLSLPLYCTYSPPTCSRHWGQIVVLSFTVIFRSQLDFSPFHSSTLVPPLFNIRCWVHCTSFSYQCSPLLWVVFHSSSLSPYHSDSYLPSIFLLWSSSAYCALPPILLPSYLCLLVGSPSFPVHLCSWLFLQEYNSISPDNINLFIRHLDDFHTQYFGPVTPYNTITPPLHPDHPIVLPHTCANPYTIPLVSHK